MSKREAKKEHLLELGLEVMKSQGYNGTSVKDIVEAAEVPKGSFYTYFDSKETFAVEAIEKAAQESYQQAQSILVFSAQSAINRLQNYFTVNADQACAGEFKVGCFLGNMCQEMADNSDAIRHTIRQALQQYTQLIEQVIKEGQQQGEISSDKDPAVLAEFLFNAWEGTLMKMKAAKCREPLDAFLAMLPVLV